MSRALPRCRAPIEQRCAAGSDSVRAAMTLSRQAYVFTVRQATRGDGVIGIDVAQSACPPMSQRAGHVTHEGQASEWRQWVSPHHRPEQPRPGELAGMRLLPLARRDTGAALRRGAVTLDQEGHVGREITSARRKWQHPNRFRPHLTVGMWTSPQEQRARSCDRLPVLHQRPVDELDTAPFPLHGRLYLYRFQQDGRNRSTVSRAGWKPGSTPRCSMPQPNRPPTIWPPMVAPQGPRVIGSGR